MKIWVKRCPCGEDTFGPLRTEVDESCSVCGRDIRDVPLREDECMGVVREVPERPTGPAEAEATDTRRRIAWIDTASHEQLLRLWRFEPAGSPWFTGKVGEHFSRVLRERRNENPAEHTRASKSIGWCEETTDGGGR